MASDDDHTITTDSAPEVPIGEAAPAKKAVAKRAPRKATKKASTPQQAPSLLPEVTGTPTAEDQGETPGMTAPPARKPAKRAPRKSAKKSVAPSLELTPAELEPELQPDLVPAPEPVPEPVAEAEPVTVPAVQSFGLLFQPPAPTQAPRRRRATAPAAAPAPEQAPTYQAAAQAALAHRDEAQQDEPQDDEARRYGAQDSGDSDDSDDSDDSGGTPRRRRRGGKGRRGRSTGDGGGDESTTNAESGSGANAESHQGANADEVSGSATSPDRPATQEGESGEGDESHRRTRRRRRGSAGESDDQQQQQSGSGTGSGSSTTTKVRAPRANRDEVTSVKGSTRLEAKKQRRREGREAGRRRTVITEAEFLARRESVERVMVVRHKQDRTQIGVLEDGVLVEHYVSDEANASMAGNVYLGRIQNVLPSMEAAFVDIGKGRNAVLYAGEVNWDAAGLDHRARRIENALSSGQGVLVQVTKDPIGHKGARLTSQVSLPGRYLVYVPDGNMMGISRKLPDTERARLKKILREVVPENAGVIVRTAAEGASEEELRADVTRLTGVWEGIQARSKSANAPALLHGESDLTVRVIRDVFNEDFAKLIVAGEPAWETVNEYVSTAAPDLAERIQKWTGEQDLFTAHRVDEQIAKAMDRKVWLPSGGTLVIDRTEAMTVVDVNTGKFVGSGGNLEETVTKNNIEAAEEVVRQLRLRDIGGIIVIDFIDMVLESNRDLVVRRLLECLGRDRTKHQVAEVTSLGLVQMTRKRVGAGLIEVFSDTCEHCNGRGIIVSADPIDRSSGSDSSGGNNNSGGGGGGGGADAGGGRGTRGRRSRGTARDTNASSAPAPELKGTTSGPTPAQIAAALHAAAVQATSPEERSVPSGQVASHGEVASSGETASSGEPARTGDPAPTGDVAPSGEVVRPGETALSGETACSDESAFVGQPASLSADSRFGEEASPIAEMAETPVEVAAPPRSRRRSSRSAKSPAISVAPTAPLMTVEPVVVESEASGSSFAASTSAESAPAAESGQTSAWMGEPSADLPVEVAAPPGSRRRSSRSAKSPAISVAPTAPLMTVEPVVVESEASGSSFAPSTAWAESSPAADFAPVAGPAEVAEVPAVAAPAARSRRKRARVMAPAGPPRGADETEPAGGEFGS